MSTWLRRIHAFLDSRLGTALLVVVVPLTVVRELSPSDAWWPLFFGIFAAIAVLRWHAAPSAPVERLDRLFGGIDVVAALTFLPFEAWIPDLPPQLGHSLRALRLLVLLRPARHVLRDLYGILSRRERLRQFGAVTVAVGTLAFLSAVLLITAGPSHDFNEDGSSRADSFLDVLWWSFRQLESADNLLHTLREDPLLVAVSMLLTITGVFIVAFIIGIGASIVEQLVQAQRRRAVDFVAHSIVVGPVHEAEVLVRQFVRIYAKNRARWLSLDRLLALVGRSSHYRHGRPHVALLGQREDPPPYLYEPLMRAVVYRSGDPTTKRGLELVAAERAKRAILLTQGDCAPDEADGITIAALGALRRTNTEALVYAEVMDGHNVGAVRAVGGPGTYALDVPRLLGLFLCQHLVVPGVERLYDELLGVEGQELYTHVFVDGPEVQSLRAWARDEPTVPWSAIWQAAQRYDTGLVGVLLGPADARTTSGMSAVLTDDLATWMNPAGDPESSEAAKLDGRAGRIPLANVRGLVGLCETYHGMRTCGRGLLRDRTRFAKVAVPDRKWLAVASRLVVDDGNIERMLVVGVNAALPSMVGELFRFRPRIEITLLAPAELGEQELDGRLGELPVAWPARSGSLDGDGLEIPAGDGGKLRIVRSRGPSMGRCAVEMAHRLGELDAAVYLSEPRAADPDARTGLRAIRLAQAFHARRCAHSKRVALLVEMQSEDKGDVLRHDVRKVAPEAESWLRLTTLSTERIKNYFMVHSAFVPAVTRVYDELLTERGQEFVRLQWPGSEGEIAYGQLSHALSERGMVPIGYERTADRVVVGPAADERIALDDLRAIFVIGDTATDAQRLAEMRKRFEV